MTRVESSIEVLHLILHRLGRNTIEYSTYGFSFQSIEVAFFTNNYGFSKSHFFEKKMEEFRRVANQLKWGASSRWLLSPNSEWEGKEPMTIEKAHPTLVVAKFSGNKSIDH